jgi:hypothetical protein
VDNTSCMQLALPFVPRQQKPITTDRAMDVHRTTVYRLDTPANRDGLLRALNRDYLADKDFTVEDVSIAGVPALLVHGVVPRATAEWCDIVGGLTGVDVAIGYSTAGSAILLAEHHIV